MTKDSSSVKHLPLQPTRAKGKSAAFVLAGVIVALFLLLQIFILSGDSLRQYMRLDLEQQVASDQTSPCFHSPSAQDIVNKAFNESFVHLTECPDDMNMMQCLDETFNRNENRSSVPWWFQTMIQYAPITGTLWHTQLARNAEDNGDLLKFCTIEKIGTKHWKEVFCILQNKPFTGKSCVADHNIGEDVPKAVFLRDPLERFLSAYIDKCLSKRRTYERHCEPDIVFLDDKNGLQKGLAKNQKLRFEAYVEAMPLKWNVHFFPQSLYCDGLFRRFPSYDFVGMMDQNFYNDLHRMGLRYGDRMMDALETVFSIKQALNESRRNGGVETAASTHVFEFYTPKSVRRVLEYMAIDYVMLSIPIPTWADAILQQESLV